MRITLAIGLALATSSASAMPQLPYVEVEFDPGLLLPGGLVSQIQSVSAGADDGWVAVSSRALPSGGRAPAIYGAFSANAPGPPQLLRIEETLQGISQDGFFDARLAAGRVAYLTNISALTLSPTAAWVDDDLVTQRGDAVGGSGLVWERLLQLHLAVDGSLTLEGTASTTPAGAQAVVVSYPSEEVLLRAGTPLSALGETIQGFRSFDLSPDGQHWCAVVDLSPSLMSIILVDGSVYEVAPSSPLITGQSLAIFGSPAGSQQLQFIHGARITDAGEVIIDIDHGDRRLIARDLIFAQEVDPIEGRLLGVDGIGRALVQRPSQGGLGASLGGERLDTDQPRGVDLDGDGLVDPSIVLFHGGVSTPSPSLSISAKGDVFGITRITPDGGAPRRIVLRASLATRQEIVCAGIPNQRGRAAHLRVTGQDHVRYGRLRLQIIDLPSSSTALPLFSKSTGNAPLLGGGIGTLCLGGAVGRSAAVIAQPTGAPFEAAVDLYLGSIPQPGGAAWGLAGETWFMQAWYRDWDGAGPTSNLSDAIAVLLR